MKTFFALALIFLAAGCSSPDKEKEDFTPFPGGKCCEEKPRS